MGQVDIRTNGRTLEQLQQEIYDKGIDYTVRKDDLSYDTIVLITKEEEDEQD